MGRAKTSTVNIACMQPLTSGHISNDKHQYYQLAKLVCIQLLQALLGTCFCVHTPTTGSMPISISAKTSDHVRVTYNVLVGVDEPMHQSKDSLQSRMSDGQYCESLSSISRVEGVVLLLQQLAAACHAQQAGPHSITAVMPTQQLPPAAVPRYVTVGTCLLANTCMLAEAYHSS